MKERYRDDHTTHPGLDQNLWLETRLFDGSDRNQIEGLSKTMIKDIQKIYSVLTVGCL